MWETMPRHYGGITTIQSLRNLSTSAKQCMSQSSRCAVSLDVYRVVIMDIPMIGLLLTSAGIGSDFLAKVMRASRLWCLTAASLIFLVAQCLALNIENPHFLSLVSGLTGLAYGFLFGCFPSLVAEAFGIHGLSTNWGCMTLAPIFSANIFNLFYGIIYDKHSIVEPSGERECTEGLGCYRSAYIVTACACILGLAVSLWSIWWTHRAREKEKDLEGREA